MDAIQTHPSNATQAKSFISPGSLSFPGGHNELTPPGDAAHKVVGAPNGHAPAGSPAANGAAVAPATPAATPGAQQTGSGLVPTLQ
jgi:transcription initiation factor TFIID TATA-box-binding protein